MIPKILHQIWIGNAPQHPSFVTWRERWQALHPDWAIKLWVNDPAGGVNGDIVCGNERLRSRHHELLVRACNLAQRANIWRQEILFAQGGLYVDTDIEPLKNLDHLLAGHDAVVSRMWKAEPDGSVRHSSAFLAATPGHPWVADMLAALATCIPEIPLSMGDSLVTKMVRKHLDVHVLGSREVIFHGPKTGWRNIDRESPPTEETCAVHRWSSAWYPTGFANIDQAARPFAFSFGGKVTGGDYYGPGYLDELRKVATRALVDGGWVLEWGSGVSTLMLADMIAPRDDCKLVTIDDNESYLQAVLDAMPDKRNVMAVSSDLSGASRNQADQGLGYSTVPFALAHPAPWKLIAIDGRRRMECAFMALLLATEDTTIILHDYRRLRYQPILGLCDIISDQPQYRVMRPNAAVLTAFESARDRMMSACSDQKLRAQALADIKILCA